MEVKFSTRGNGACPVCQKRENCVIHRQLRKAVEDIANPQQYELEAVIYNCPMFDEEF